MFFLFVCFVLFCFVLFCFVLFCFVLFCFVLFCFVLFFFLWTLFYNRMVSQDHVPTPHLEEEMKDIPFLFRERDWEGEKETGRERGQPQPRRGEGVREGVREGVSSFSRNRKRRILGGFFSFFIYLLKQHLTSLLQTFSPLHFLPLPSLLSLFPLPRLPYGPLSHLFLRFPPPCLP